MKISISIPDAELVEWAKKKAEREGISLSEFFTEAVRVERRLEAGRDLLATWPERPALTNEDRAAIRAEWAGGARYEPKTAPKKRTRGRSRTAGARPKP